MKIRSDFVTNSSSSAFVILLDDLTPTQVDIIENHIEYAKNVLGWHIGEYDDAWNVYQEGPYLKGEVWLDNFSMYEVMESIGVDMDKVTFGDWLHHIEENLIPQERCDERKVYDQQMRDNIESWIKHMDELRGINED